METMYNQLLLQFLSNQSETSHKCYRHIEDVHFLLKRKKNSFEKVTAFLDFKIYSVWLIHYGKVVMINSINCSYSDGGGRVVRRCWVNFQSRGVLLIWIIVGQGPIALVVGAGGGCLDIFSLSYHFFFLSPSLWETARYRLKYCLKGPLSLKQPTNQLQ